MHNLLKSQNCTSDRINEFSVVLTGILISKNLLIDFNPVKKVWNTECIPAKCNKYRVYTNLIEYSQH